MKGIKELVDMVQLNRDDIERFLSEDNAAIIKHGGGTMLLENIYCGGVCGEYIGEHALTIGYGKGVYREPQPKIKLETYGDVCAVLDALLEALPDVGRTILSKQVEITFYDEKLALAMHEKNDMRKLHDNGTIDDEMYEEWQKQHRERLSGIPIERKDNKNEPYNR